jgi:hypothetical protein
MPTSPVGPKPMREVVDADMDELPTQAFTSASAIALSPAIAGDAMADAIDLAQLLDVDVDELTRLFALKHAIVQSKYSLH